MGPDPYQGDAGAGRDGRARLSRRQFGALAVSALALGAAATASAAPVFAAQTVDYPSWDDVLKAQQSEKATQALVTQIRSQISALQAQVEQTQAEANEKGAIYGEAQQAADDQAYIASQLQAQADAAQAEADSARETARQLIAQLARTGNTDITATLLAGGGDAEDLLYRLGATNLLGERFAGIYELAVQKQNTATSLADQAAVASAKREELAAVAQQAFEEAQAAALRVQDQLAAQLSQQQQLEAQLTALVEKRKTTEAEYLAGVAAQWGSGSSGYVSSTGWALPADGYISSNFGYRTYPWPGMHTGVDIAGGGYNAPIRAAHAGTVIFAGSSGSTLGNYVQIDHGNGVVTGYAHINVNGIGVRIGQSVAPGEVIAKVGATGAATGPHLHYMIYVNGGLVDPVPYMRNQGIQIGG